MALTKLKMAVFAPMPIANVIMATAVKPGFFSNWRMADLRSFMVSGQWTKSQIPNTKLQRNPKHQTPMAAAQPVYWSLRFGASLVFGAWCFELSFVSQRLHRIDACRATGRQQAGKQRDGGEEERRSSQHDRVGRLRLKK